MADPEMNYEINEWAEQQVEQDHRHDSAHYATNLIPEMDATGLPPAPPKKKGKKERKDRESTARTALPPLPEAPAGQAKPFMTRSTTFGLEIGFDEEAMRKESS